LASHPDVYMPTRRKEIRFFNQYYDRGLQWYEKLFPSDAEAKNYRAIGEISPRYLYCPGCPERIASIPTITKLILILRNPVDRAYSAYGEQVRSRKFSGSFGSFLDVKPEVIELGFYSPRIRDYWRHFRRDQLLVLIFEDAVVSVTTTKEILAGFLGVAADRFPASAGTSSINRSYVPKRLPVPHTWTRRVFRKLRDWDLDQVGSLMVTLAKPFREDRPLPPMTLEERRSLAEVYKGEIAELAVLLEVDLGSWEWREESSHGDQP
jgi:hypothetical protein